jgi:tetratricopeptide (TPR) repeat protein
VDIRARLQAHLGDAFQVERELGGGGMSRVFVATEVRLNRRVAIKVLTPELAQGLNAERFEREILLAASLQQANIVPLLSAGDFDGLPYFTMPFIEGESLRQRAGGREMPIAQVVAVLRDVARALEYAHARGIVHRDIKPDNVLLSGATAVVTDFGIAKALSASRGDGTPSGTLTSVGTSIGTPSYMAPEQVAGDPNIDHRVDLYALGCLAFELLAGEPPFGTRTPQKILAAHLSEAPRAVETIRAECPPQLALLVARLLEKDPADRIGSASEVLQALDDVGATTSAPTAILQGPGMFGRVLALYAVAVVAVAILAKAAVVGIGLPEWVVPGAVGVMLLGLPIILFTGYVKRVARKAAAASPTLTPGGTMAARPLGTMATMALRASPHVSWRRAMRLKIALMSGFVLLVAGFLVTRAMGIGPAASLFAAGTLAADDRIVLADFTAAPEDSALAPIVQAAVREAMGQSRAVKLLDAAAVAAELERMQRPNAALDATTARDVAVRSGAKAILGGRLARAGTGFAVSLDLVATDGAATLASFQGTANGPGDLLTVVDDLTRKLRGKMGESLKQVARSIPLEQATTSNLEALRLFTEGTRANDFEGDYETAVRVLREAVALDSTFALAWRKLSAALFNARLPRLAQDSALDKAAQYAEKLPARERLLIMGALYDRHSTRADRAKSLDAYRQLYALDSTERVTVNQIALLHMERGEIDSAARYFRRQVDLEPAPTNREKVAQILARQGKVDEALALLDSIKRDSPAYAAAQQLTPVEMEVRYTAGDLGTVRTLAEELRTATAPRNRLMGLNFSAVLDNAAGKLRSAAALEAERVAYQGTRGVRQVPLWEISQDIYFRGQPAAGVAKLDKLVASPAWAAVPPLGRPYLQAADLYAEAGEPEKARRMITAAREASPDQYATPIGLIAIKAREVTILLAEQKPAEALALARETAIAPDGAPAECQACVAFTLGAVFDSLGQRDSTVHWFEQYLATSRMGRAFNDAWMLATVQKRLGELYDARGDRTKAITHYQAFVDQWADADPELQPTVASVRKRIEELKQQGG